MSGPWVLRLWRRWRSVQPEAIALIIIGVGALSAHAQSRQWRILLLYPDINVPAAASVSEGVKRKLATAPALKIQTFNEFLGLTRFPGDEHKQRTLRYLSEKYATTKLDVVVAQGRDALRAALENRESLAPGVPVVFCCVSPPTLSAIQLPADVTGVTSEFSITKTLNLARHLQPEARNLIVIAGATPFDQRWVEIASSQLDGNWEHDKQYLVGLNRETLLHQVARLPRDSIVIMLTMFKDGRGDDFVPAEIAEEVAMASSAPIYAPYASWLGRGFVGGHSDTFEDIGTQAADIVLRIMAGEDVRQIPIRSSTTQALRVDARQLDRWKLSERNLPSNTVIEFRKPGLLEEHPNVVLGAIIVLIAGVGVIGLQLAQIGRRKKVEAQLKESEDRLTLTAAATNTGLWRYHFPTRHLWATDQARVMFGLDAVSSLQPTAFLRSVHPDDRPIAAAAIKMAAQKEPQVKTVEFRVEQPGGLTRWILTSSRTQFDDECKPYCTSGVFRDVTERKQAEHRAEQLVERVASIQEEERRHIAQELHDSTTQHLVAATLLMMVVQKHSEADPKMHQLCSDIKSCLDEATKEIRTRSYLLYPPQLGPDGLRSAVRRYIEGFSRRTDIEIKLKISPQVDHLPPASNRELLRVVQEALANVRRHACASHVSISIRCMAERLHLVVSDNGKGIDAELNGHRAGVGIPGMTERLRRLGGDLEVRSGPDGTTLHGVIPTRVNRGAPC